MTCPICASGSKEVHRCDTPKVRPSPTVDEARKRLSAVTEQMRALIDTYLDETGVKITEVHVRYTDFGPERVSGLRVEVDL